jgi:ribonuclease P protein component
MIAAANRLRRHGEYQRVYRSSRKRFGKQMSYFFLLRELPSTTESGMPTGSTSGPRVGLTVSRAMGKAVVRNRIKRRMREAVRRQIAMLQAPVDVVLHPNRRVTEIEFAVLEQDVAQVFRAIQQSLERDARTRISKPAGERL